MKTESPAGLYALVIGGVLLVAGIVGFFYSSSFGSPGDVDSVFGILDVNAWHNIVHIATGALGLVAWRFGAVRQYALALGAVYVAVAVWGFVIGSGDSILGFIPINTEDNVLHLVIGLAGVGAGYASHPVPTTPAPTGAAPAH